MATTLESQILKNMALVMEQERHRRRMTTAELAQLCELTESEYLGILDCSVNLRLSAIDRIGRTLEIPLVQLFGGPSRKRNHH